MQQQATSTDVKLTLENRKHLSMTGVDAVNGFSEQNLKLTVAGESVIITGENIKITAYNKLSGSLSAEGKFTEIKYSYKKPSLVKRIFK